MKLHNYTLIAFSFSILLSGFNVRGDDLEGKIKDFILKNPEVIIESLQKFEVKKENEKKLENKNKINTLSKQLYNSESLFEGNKLSNKIIVEFFDYNCSYCRRAHQDLKKIISEDKNIKVIYKNYPILSENSIKLAKYALIISEIDKKKFVKFHNLILTNKGKINDDILISILKELNIDKNYIENKINDAVLNADAILILTEWRIYKKINWKTVEKVIRKPCWVFDTRSIVDPKEIKNTNLNFWRIGDGIIKS